MADDDYLADDTDVSIVSPVANDVLTWEDGTQLWKNKPSYLRNDTDVSIGSPTNGYVLRYTSGAWSPHAAPAPITLPQIQFHYDGFVTFETSPAWTAGGDGTVSWSVTGGTVYGAGSVVGGTLSVYKNGVFQVSTALPVVAPGASFSSNITSGFSFVTGDQITVAYSSTYYDAANINVALTVVQN